MIGAFLGDMIGAPYEHYRGKVDKDFPLFVRESRVTDDSVMTCAVAEALLDMPEQADPSGDGAFKAALVRSMQKWGRRYPRAGYGRTFKAWLAAEDPQPYGSWGNGSAMRVSPVGWLFRTMEDTRRFARLSAEVTHDHPEGIKGAEAVASAIFLARSNAGKEEIRKYVTQEFGYDLTRTCDEIRPDYGFDVSCQGSVPEAITAFLDGNGFEDTVRTAVSLGGDTDTIACIAGSIAEAWDTIPGMMRLECLRRLPDDMRALLARFEAARDKV